MRHALKDIVAMPRHKTSRPLADALNHCTMHLTREQNGLMLKIPKDLYPGLLQHSIKGAGVAHKWTSPKTKAPPLHAIINDERGEARYTPLSKGAYYQEVWEKHWENSG